MADFENQKSTDGWIGDPDILLAHETSNEGRSPFSGFHGFNLMRRIFLANFIALAVLLIGSVLLGQPQSQFTKAARAYLTENANYEKKLIERELAEFSDAENTVLLEKAIEKLPQHLGVTVGYFSDTLELVAKSEAQIYKRDAADPKVDEQSFGIWGTAVRFLGIDRNQPDAEGLEEFCKTILNRLQDGDSAPQQFVLRSGDTVFGIARGLR